MKKYLIIAILIGCANGPSDSSIDASVAIDSPTIVAMDAEDPPDLLVATDHTITIDHTVAAADRVSTTDDHVFDVVASDVCVPTPERCNGLDDDCDGRVDEPEDADAACVVPQGRGSCIAGRCYLASCDADRGDCDRDLSNGCETDLTRTLDHCGACGRRCGGFDACVTSVCGPMTDVDVGLNHACAVHSTGRVVCWGRNDFGQLGDGTRVDRARPVVVQLLPTASTVRVADTFSCIVTTDRMNVLCWGQRGLGGRQDTRDLPGNHREVIWPPQAWARPPLVGDGLSDRQRRRWPAGLEGAPVHALHVSPWGARASFPYIDGDTSAYVWHSWSIVGPTEAWPTNGDVPIWGFPRAVVRWGESVGTAMSDLCSVLAAQAHPSTRSCFDNSRRDDRLVGYHPDPVFSHNHGSRTARVVGVGYLEWMGTLLPPVPDASIVRGSQYSIGPPQGPHPLLTLVERLAGGKKLCLLVANESHWRCVDAQRIDAAYYDSARVLASPVSFLPRNLSRLRLFQEGDGGCYLTEGGRVFCWGDNTYGRLGDGTTLPRSEPVPVLGR